MVFSSTPEFMRINTNLLKFFRIMLKSSYTKSGVKLLRTNFLACFTRVGGWVAKLDLHKSIYDLGQHVPCAHLILDLKTFSKFERGKEDKSFRQLSK